MPKKTQNMGPYQIGTELKTEGRCYCQCWKCSSLIVTFDCTPLATPTSSLVEKPSRTNYIANNPNNNSALLSVLASKLEEIKVPNGPVALKENLAIVPFQPKKEQEIKTEPVKEEKIEKVKAKPLSKQSPELIIQPEMKIEPMIEEKANAKPIDVPEPEVKPIEVLEVKPVEETKPESNEIKYEPIEVTTVEKVLKPITSKSTATLIDDGTIELITVTESDGVVLHTAVTKINVPEIEDYRDIFDYYQNRYRPLRVIEEDQPNSAQSNYYETEITTTTTVNVDGSVTKTTKTTTTIKKTTVITILTSDGRVLIKSRAL